MQLIERVFKLTEHETTVRTEVIAGVTTFLTMAYIIFVNPSILGAAGMPKDAVFVCTCIVAALGTTIMALYANYPIALAPGMGLNAYFAFVVVMHMGYTWQAALGMVFISGCLFIAVTVIGLRSLIINGIPHSLRSAITVGIGLFLAIIALKSAGIVVKSDATFVTLGDLHTAPVVLASLGFLVIVALDRLKVPGAILIGIVATTVASFFFGNHFAGIFSAPPSIAPTFLKLDIKGALAGGFLNVVLVFFLVELFDATGTLMGIANRAGLLTPARMGRLNRALMADSVSIFCGSLLGTSSTTAYAESAAGVQAGGRTGLTAITVAVLFLACLFIAPLAGAVPAYATAPALFFVACLMMRELVALDWDETTEVVPAAVTALMMPFTYSIANGLAFGFISYALIKLLTGKVKDVHWMTWLIGAVFLFKFIYVGG
ncbi:MAG: NCS2 family permease [Burkholderiales bacterium]|nr:NCS2 family permease [Burkholderiales bacterium]TBR77724.1 MAG: NCS2 family permease [Burkholderiaceae bacterium]